MSAGDRVQIQKDRKTYEGILMPSSSNKIVLKLDSGYNIGFGSDAKITKKHGEKKEMKHAKKEKIHFDPGKKTITILHTGGTIASRVDYKTGAVTPAFEPEDLIEMYPELKGIANIKSRLISNMFSDDMRFAHYKIIASEIKEEIEEGCGGVIVTHGTDTMAYTSAALSFILQDNPIPIILTGAQRSSDRGSSDAALNLISSARFIADSDFSGVAICMHGSMSDDFCFVLSPTKTRKMHTSRRDAFRPINDLPIAKISANGTIEFIKKDYHKANKLRKLNLKNNFEEKVALLKIHTNMMPEQFSFFNGYKGLVIEGTGLGHTPLDTIDDATKIHEKIKQAIEELAKSCVICMATQCLYGRVNMNVYSKGRNLQNMGIIPLADMLPETAFIKLAWALGHTKDPKEVKELMLRNVAGEFSERSDVRYEVGMD